MLGHLGTVDPFKLALEAAPTGMLMVDADGRILLVNAHIEKLFGYAREELLGEPVEMLVPSAQRAGHPSSRARFFEQPSTRPMGASRDLFGLHKNGSEIPIEIGLNPVTIGEQLCVLSSVVDITERRRALEQFRLAIEAAPTGMLMVDRDGKMVLVNAQIERLFGYQRQELIGHNMEMLLPERFRQSHPGFRQGFFANPSTRPMGVGRDLYGLRKDGSEIRVEIGLNPLHTQEGEFVLSSVADVTERRRAEEEREGLLEQLRTLNATLGRSLREREALLQEVHHRVKNNLQVISSLINMQVRKLPEGDGASALSECQTRIQAIALIHEKLYQSSDYSKVPFSDYVASLATAVFHAMGASASRVSLRLQLDETTLAVEQAIPAGLVLNELLTNSLKHAFPDDRSGQLTVELRRLADGKLRLAVKDDGIGLVQVGGPQSLGLQLVRTLAEQLDAELQVDGHGGTSISLCFAEGNAQP